YRFPHSEVAGGPGLAEQEALAEIDVVVEQLLERALVLDLLDDDVDGGAVEHALERAHALGALVAQMGEQGRRVDLHEAKIAARQLLVVEVEPVDLIERETEAEIAKLLEIRRRRGREVGDVALHEVEHQIARKVGVLGEELEELVEELVVGQGVGRYVAEEPDIAVAPLELAHELDAAEQQHVVDRAHEAGARSD